MHEFELNYWNNCCNTFDEDQKHYIYAKYMHISRQNYSFDAQNKRIVDIGGGPTSMLLKCKNLQQGLVVDPLLDSYPNWIKQRYDCAHIMYISKNGEDFVSSDVWDEVWIYNCLQHVINPKQLLANAKHAAPIIRLFEWIDMPAHAGHPHELTEEFLEHELGKGVVVDLHNEQGCTGRAFTCVFYE